MPIQISIDTELTLANLVSKKQQGYMVEETPHVGNLSLSTLALLSLGLRAKLVDVTVGSKDTLFYPHYQIANGEQTIIANPNLMTTHNTVIGCGESLSEFHLRPIAVRPWDIFTHSSWVASRKEIILKTIEIALQKIPTVNGVWGRHVSKEGIVSERQPSGRILDHIHKVTTLPTDEGWVVPNPFNILFDLVCGSLESEKATIYMLSGQSMYKYIHQPYRHFGAMSKLISELYDTTRNYAFSQLPKDLNVVMVPVPVIRNFVGPLQLKEQLDCKLGFYEKLKIANARCGRKLSEGQLSHPTVRRLKQKRRILFDSAAKPMSLACADSETGVFYSQHDLDQDVIYIPNQVMDMPIRSMLDTVAKMRHLSA